MGKQTTAKTLFLLASMVGWLILGAALIYLSPYLADRILPSDRTHLWMQTLDRGGYYPTLAWLVGGIALGINILANIIWYQRFEGKV
jgi:hypothetical protein